MRYGRRWMLAGLGVVLSACAAPGPTASVLDASSQEAVQIRSVSVSGAGMGATTSGEQVPTASVVAILEEEAQRLVGRGDGQTPTRVVIELESVNLITAAQSMLLGGESVMKGTVSLVDARDGRVILPPRAVESGGGGWIMGGLLGAASRDDPATELKQLSQEFVTRASVLIFGV